MPENGNLRVQNRHFSILKEEFIIFTIYIYHFNGFNYGTY